MIRQLWTAGVGLMLVALPAVAADQAEKPTQQDATKAQLNVIVPAVDLGEYWIGVEVAPLSDELRAQLEIPEGRSGVLVGGVIPESPAAKAGIHEGDLMIAVGEKELNTVQELIARINKAKEKELSIRLIRDGKERTVQVTPTKRPPEFRMERRFQRLLRPEEEKRGGVFGWVWPGDGDQQWLRYHILVGPQAKLPPLPDDMTITITKKGKKPARITVKQGDERWAATENKLDELPDEVRPHVERMLGRRAWPNWNWMEHKLPEFNRKRLHVPLPGMDLEKRMEKMNHRIEELRKMIHELRERHAPEKKAETPAETP